MNKARHVHLLIAPYVTLPYLWGGQLMHLSSAEAISVRPYAQLVISNY